MPRRHVIPKCLTGNSNVQQRRPAQDVSSSVIDPATSSMTFSDLNGHASDSILAYSCQYPHLDTSTRTFSSVYESTDNCRETRNWIDWGHLRNQRGEKCHHEVSDKATANQSANCETNVGFLQFIHSASMPRRPRLSPLRRSGCATCKYRHRKCDEQKPRCGNGHRLGLECKQSELFRVSKLPRYDIDIFSYFNCSLDAASPEVPAGRDTHEDHGLLDNEEEDNNIGIVGTAPKSTPSMSCIGFSPSQGVPLTWEQPQASSMEHYLLHHYIFNMSTVLFNVDSPSNPLRSVLLPRAVTSQTLMNALYAASALHVFVGKRDSEFQTQSLTYYNKAASALHHLIISGGSNGRFHLQGIQKMFDIRFFQDNIAKLAPETVAYVQSFIAYHTHIAGLTRLEKLSSPTTIDTEQEFEPDMESLNIKIDPYMGVSASFISLLHVAAATITVDPTKPTNLDIMMKSVIKLYHRLQSDQVKKPVSLSPSEELAMERIDCLDHIANVYRNAFGLFLIFLHLARL
ncbi:hypothetical protein BGW36DRAFT_412845 [Talaromyces proteolyticus]|uniref:Zn(2)-C6 fungal-type domain-containing protein n=1 Tax=Talaromyces proteolyticus TaxID=1131652 RepID=A0AAD4KCZ4_9EURO|nr:uncharacterized protein BGW36DRAFT_412845 [Talaromyces proteolyticus]KAH8688657.1 hypothetical protein BGW36DRAFT_412845 [Talaromyces proteolyticus]